MKQHRLLVQII